MVLHRQFNFDKLLIGEVIMSSMHSYKFLGVHKEFKSRDAVFTNEMQWLYN